MGAGLSQELISKPSFVGGKARLTLSFEAHDFSSPFIFFSLRSLDLHHLCASVKRNDEPSETLLN